MSKLLFITGFIFYSFLSLLLNPLTIVVIADGMLRNKLELNDLYSFIISFIFGLLYFLLWGKLITLPKRYHKILSDCLNNKRGTK